MKDVLVITRWFPNRYEPARCVFIKNLLDAQARYTRYNYTLISPVPLFPKINLPFVSKRFRNFARLDYKEQRNGYTVYRPRYFKLPHPLLKKLEWHTYLDSVLATIKKENLSFDLIHSHGLYPDGYVAVKLADYLGKPIVMHVHDSYFKKKYLVYREKIDRIMANSEKIIAVSNFQKEILIGVYPNYVTKISTIYNGIDIDKFEIGHYKKRDIVNLVFVGNLTDEKGVDILIQGIKLLQKHYNKTISLDIYGEGENKKRYQSMVNRLHLTNVIKFKGVINNEVLPQYLKEYSLFVLPSRYETFGVVLIEAMASGVPIVATRAGAIPEIVSSDEVGILVEPNNPRSLAEGIKKATNRHWNRERMRDYVQKFSLEHTAKKIEKIYNNILKINKKEDITYK